MTDRPVRVAAYGYFGMGNLGNEGTLAAFLALTRQAHPDAVLHCFAADAEAVEREHGVPATRLMSYRAAPGRSGIPATLRKAVGRLVDIPRTFRMMRDVDVLVVPGTGVLESKLVATPWGLPFWLFLAALACRLRRRKVALLNVGAEQPGHPVTRLLYRWTVRLASYCTYRDEASRDAVRALGVRGRLGGVHPDLAFSLPVPATGPERPGHVVVGVMAFEGGPDDPRRGPGMVETYVGHMARLITRLVEQGRTVTLVVGDLGDRPLTTRIVHAVQEARPDLAPSMVEVSDATDLAATMREMARAEVVVASRFHNVICALKTTRPTVSLGYAEKNAHVLGDFGLGRFSQPMESLDVDIVLDHLDEVQRLHPSVEAQMKETLQRYQDDLEVQFREFSAFVVDAATRRG